MYQIRDQGDQTELATGISEVPDSSDERLMEVDENE